MFDAAAPKSAANAFTSAGADLFGPSAAPSTSGSSAPSADLVPHEAAHVVQQSAGKASAAPFAGMY